MRFDESKKRILCHMGWVINIVVITGSDIKDRD
jgi:hypothetical protein